MRLFDRRTSRSNSDRIALHRLLGVLCAIGGALFMPFLFVYLGLLLLKTVWEDSASLPFDLNLLLVVVLVSGLLAFLGHESKEGAPRPSVIELKELAFVFALASMGAIIVWYEAADLGRCSFLLSVATGSIIVLVSVLALAGEGPIEIENVGRLKQFTKANLAYFLAASLGLVIFWTVVIGPIFVLGLRLRIGYLLALIFLTCWACKLDFKFQMVFAALFFVVSSLSLFRGDQMVSQILGLIAFVFLIIGSHSWVTLWAKDKTVSPEVVSIAFGFLLLVSSWLILFLTTDPRKASLAAAGAYLFLFMAGAARLARSFAERGIARRAADVLINGIFSHANKGLRRDGSLRESSSPSASQNGGRFRDRRWRIRVLSGVGISAVALTAGALYLSNGRIWQSEKVTTGGKRAITTANRDSGRSSKIKAYPSVEKESTKVQVLNATGVDGEAEAVKQLLEEGEFDVISTADIDSLENAQTQIRYKIHREDQARSAASTISELYPADLVDDLADNEAVDAVVILGTDKRGGLIDKSKLEVEVQNGSGTKGAAGRIAELLRQNDFRVTSVRDARRSDFAHTTVMYKPGNKRAAQIVADRIRASYQATLKQGSNLATDIVVILGRR